MLDNLISVPAADNPQSFEPGFRPGQEQGYQIVEMDDDDQRWTVVAPDGARHAVVRDYDGELLVFDGHRDTARFSRNITSGGPRKKIYVETLEEFYHSRLRAPETRGFQGPLRRMASMREELDQRQYLRNLSDQWQEELAAFPPEAGADYQTAPERPEDEAGEASEASQEPSDSEEVT